ncbi:MAG: hypothetical protein JSS02_34710 [Planctomycetes bacterium]|nr:hypothetical protein [Planctomycetota bacterium]
MICKFSNMLTVVVGLTLITCARPGLAQERAANPPGIDGFWSGSWGGGARDGVVFQPVIAEFVIKGDQVELSGFPQIGQFRGKVAFDAKTRRMRLTSPAANGVQASPQVFDYRYELKADQLTLTAGDQAAVTLNKVAVTEKPLANGQLELVAAAGINDADSLLVTRYSVLRAGGIGASFYRAQKQTLSLKQATVLLVQDADAKPVTIAEARRLLAKPRPVAVTFRQVAHPAADSAHTLWQDIGSAPPDSEAARQTWAQILRPGTLVFVLPAAENEPQP